MALPLQKLREIIFQMLYSYDIGKAHQQDMIELMMKELAVSRASVIMAQQKVEEIQAIQEEIDGMIAGASFSYAFDRIQTVERNILRLGVYELFFASNIPPKVAISEAVRMSRKFSTPESANFVNAVLDTLYKARAGEEIDLQKIYKTIEEMTQSEEKSSSLPLEKEMAEE
ncbi:N utilization substance protein B-like protein [Neochlamydia sp. TUME1]|uniref:transcription antitermination factor NusB n=1 Tax=unclassified Neochlamydia TaxID=2643326 RepID=UPI0005830416|nr:MULTISPECIES: transcription antitermination factor NusB [unclassified Neochlamydia]KIC77065.1 N utilization substance protein B-like protein [Neochlamydia sp. TUME1]BBI17518.1 N utilization substance protein B homolog [Neochlamydia sp. S13]